MRFCLKCGATYENDDTARECFNRKDDERCRGDIVPKPKGPECLVCEDKGRLVVLGEVADCKRPGCVKWRKDSAAS